MPLKRLSTCIILNQTTRFAFNPEIFSLQIPTDAKQCTPLVHTIRPTVLISICFIDTEEEAVMSHYCQGNY